MIEKALAELELLHEWAFLEPFLGFQIALAADPDASKGRSRIGGGADLGAGVAWPCQRWPRDEIARWPDYAKDEVNQALAEGRVRVEGSDWVMPLSFLFQIDLADVPDCEETSLLPESGLLSFFASIATDVPDPRFSKRVACAVLFAAGDSALVHAPQPPTGDPFPTRELGLRPERRLCAELPWEERQALAARTEPAVFERFEQSAGSATHSYPARPWKPRARCHRPEKSPSRDSSSTASSSSTSGTLPG